MDKMRDRTKEILSYILHNVEENPKRITKMAMEKFDISRPAAMRHINTLVDSKLLEVRGKTKGRRYELLPIKEWKYEFPPDGTLKEDRIWREKFLPSFNDIKKNVKDICAYGFTEMVNNVLEHADASSCTTYLAIWVNKIDIIVTDDGVGIFNKIRKDYGLDDDVEAILELSKGKLTTDPGHHTGEGIFFTSRSFDRFAIFSGKLQFVHLPDSGDWLVEDMEHPQDGTVVSLRIGSDSGRTLKEVFDRFTTDENYGFTKTRVPLILAKYGEEKLISRSQAKRVVTRFERFKEIILDFEGLTQIGQAFADEIFRVFQNQHPEIKLVPINTTKDIDNMISRAQSHPK
ncbi:MAG: DUF4325 domain-containing protein [Desulfobacteraceae bacterium]|nr:DUF4325 domain-containing protein [Desulfobacteraceae bacterium]